MRILEAIHIAPERLRGFLLLFSARFG